MKKLMKKMDSKIISAKLAAQRFVSNERGDTNFISIAIILIVVIVIAILFITFGQDLAELLEEKITDIMDALG